MRMRTWWLLLSLGFLGIDAGDALAWNDFGHMEVAAAAYKHLKPSARKRAIELLKQNPRYGNWILGAHARDVDRVAFMRAATWADAIKSDSSYTSQNDGQSLPTANQNLGYADKLRHTYWHFVDQPFSPDGTALVPAPAPHAATQIAAFRAALASGDATDDVKSYDLAWLLHLVGDVHQPLHCVSRYDHADPTGDRGGNNVKIKGNTQPQICDDPRYCPFDPPGELHAFYDDITGADYGTAKVDAAVRALPPPDAQQAAIGDESVWLQEGFDLAKTSVYAGPIGVGDGPFTIDAGYQSAAVVLGKQRIALAGQRLANLLNDCFAKEAAAKKK